MTTFHPVEVEVEGSSFIIICPTLILSVAERNAYIRFYLDGVK